METVLLPCCLNVYKKKVKRRVCLTQTQTIYLDDSFIRGNWAACRSLACVPSNVDLFIFLIIIFWRRGESQPNKRTLTSSKQGYLLPIQDVNNIMDEGFILSHHFITENVAESLTDFFIAWWNMSSTIPLIADYGCALSISDIRENATPLVERMMCFWKLCLIVGRCCS